MYMYVCCHASPPPLPLQVLGPVRVLPDICTELEISYFLPRRLLGVRMEGDKREAKVGGEEAVDDKVVGWLTQ